MGEKTRYYFSDFTKKWYPIEPGHVDYEVWGRTKAQMLKNQDSGVALLRKR